jgi:hypothetical protein
MINLSAVQTVAAGDGIPAELQHFPNLEPGWMECQVRG